jgi:phosphoglycerate kinase
MAIKYLKPSSIKNKAVLLRPDLNCPVENGKLTDDFRIQQSLPTIKLLYGNENKVIICAHLGRPDGQRNEKFSLRPVAERLAEILGFKFIKTDFASPNYGIRHLIFYTGDIREEKHIKQIQSIGQKDIVVLENIRFYKEEEENEAIFAKRLASLAQVYVNDAFGVDHHPSVSVSGLAQLLPSYCGLLLESEIKALDEVLKHGKHPFIVMAGGIKLSEKVGALENLGKMADKILVGGGVANLLFRAKGLEVGLSKLEDAELKTAWQIEKNFKDKLILPVDVVVANEKMDKSSIRVCLPYEVGKREQILDAGPKTILAYAKEIKTAKTIVWSGPLGLFERKPFDTATMALCRLIGGRGKGMAFAVAGGGDTVDAIRLAHQFEHIDHVSTGGGAMLEYLAGKKLPGIEALK